MIKTTLKSYTKVWLIGSKNIKNRVNRVTQDSYTLLMHHTFISESAKSAENSPSLSSEDEQDEDARVFPCEFNLFYISKDLQYDYIHGHICIDSLCWGNNMSFGTHVGNFIRQGDGFSLFFAILDCVPQQLKACNI